MQTVSRRLLAALFVALAIWGTTQGSAQSALAPVPQQVADPGVSAGGNGG